MEPVNRGKAFSIVLIFLLLWSLTSHADSYNDTADQYWNEGWVFANANKPYDAAEMFKKAAEAERKSQNTRDFALVAQLGWAGSMYYQAGYYYEALHFFREALVLDREMGDPENVVIQLGNIGSALYHLSRYDEALEAYEEALSISISYSMEERIPMYQMHLGDTYSTMGRFETAIKHYSESAVGYEEIFLLDRAAMVLNLTGVAYYEWGRYHEAFDHYNRAFALNGSLGKTAEIAKNLNNMGLVYRIWGQYDEAMNHYQRALKHAEELSDGIGIATTLNNIAGIYRIQGRHEKAIDHYEKALAVDRRNGNEEGIARELSNIGVVYTAMKKYEEAIKYYSEALELDRSRNRRWNMAVRLNNIGMVYRYWGKYEEAVARLEEALSIATSLDARNIAASTNNNLGIVYYVWGRFDRARDSLLRAVSQVETIREDIGTDTKVKATFLSQFIPTYKLLVSTLFHLGEYERAFYYSEQSRARSFLEDLSKSQIYRSFPFDTERKEIVGELELLSGEISSLESSLVTVKNVLAHESIGAKREALKKNFAEIERRINALKSRYSSKETSLIEAHPRLKELTSPEVVQYEDIRSILDEDTAVLEYSTFEEGAPLLFLIENRGLKVIQLPPESYNRTVRRYRNRLSGGSSRHESLAKALYLKLIAPVEKAIEGKKLIIIPDGILAYLPFETLLDAEGRPLVQTHSIRYIQSLSVLKMLADRPPQPGKDHPFFGVGGAIYEQSISDEDRETFVPSEEPSPEASIDGRQQSNNRSNIVYNSADADMEGTLRSLGFGDFKDLPGTLTEVETLERLFYEEERTPHVKIKADASEDRIKDLSQRGALKGYSYIHFATHGFLSTEFPRLSSIVLSQDEDPTEDGYLRMDEIIGLDLNADLVVLSACETGLGKQIKGEGVIGLTRSFMFAGTDSIVVSLWPVADESTSAFMISFYEHIRKGRSPADALRSVKLSFIRSDRWSHPLYWAPFVVYGE